MIYNRYGRETISNNKQFKPLGRPTISVSKKTHMNMLLHYTHWESYHNTTDDEYHQPIQDANKVLLSQLTAKQLSPPSYRQLYTCRDFLVQPVYPCVGTVVWLCKQFSWYDHIMGIRGFCISMVHAGSGTMMPYGHFLTKTLSISLIVW